MCNTGLSYLIHDYRQLSHCGRVSIGKLAVHPLVKKIPAIYATQMFIIVFTTAIQNYFPRQFLAATFCSYS